MMIGDNRFENKVQEMLEEHGPMDSSEIAHQLARDRFIFVIEEPDQVIEEGQAQHGGYEVIGGRLSAVSSKAVEEKLNKCFGVWQDGGGVWHSTRIGD